MSTRVKVFREHQAIFLLIIEMTKKVKYIRQFKMRKKGFSRLVDSDSSSITSSAIK